MIMNQEQQNIPKGVANDKKELFAQLFERYYIRLSHYAHQFINDFDVCRDLIQDLFMKLWELKIQDISEEELEGYIYKSVRNACFDHLRHKKIRQNSRMYILEKLLKQEEIHISELETQELANKIENTINQLPEQTALIFRMSRFDDMTYAEIAEELNLSVKSVEFHISKALKVLKLELKGYLPLIVCLIKIFEEF